LALGDEGGLHVQAVLGGAVEGVVDVDRDEERRVVVDLPGNQRREGLGVAGHLERLALARAGRSGSRGRRGCGGRGGRRRAPAGRRGGRGGGGSRAGRPGRGGRGGRRRGRRGGGGPAAGGEERAQ